MSVSSTASPGVPAQTFEVDAPRCASPGRRPFRSRCLRTPRFVNTDGSPQSVLVAGRVSGVKAGDRLVLVEQQLRREDDYWSLVTVTRLTPATTRRPAWSTRTQLRPGRVGADSAGAAAPAGAAVRRQPPGTRITGYRLLRPTAAAAIMRPSRALSATRPPGTSTRSDLSDFKAAHVRRAHRGPGDLARRPGPVRPRRGASVGARRRDRHLRGAVGHPLPRPRLPASRPSSSRTLCSLSRPPTPASCWHAAAQDPDHRRPLRPPDVGTIIGVPRHASRSLRGTVRGGLHTPSTARPRSCKTRPALGVAVTVLRRQARGTSPSPPPAPRRRRRSSKPLAGAAAAAAQPRAGVPRQDRDRRGARQRKRGARQPVLHAREVAAHLSATAAGASPTLTVTSTRSNGRRSRASTIRPRAPGYSW